MAMPSLVIRVSYMTKIIPIVLMCLLFMAPAIARQNEQSRSQLRHKIAQIQIQQQEVSALIDAPEAAWKDALQVRQEADDAMLIVLIGDLMAAEPEASDLGDYAPLRWRALRRSGDPVKALKEAEALLQVRPDLKSTMAEMALELAWYRSVLGSPEEAVAVANEFTEAHPEIEGGALLLEAATARLSSDNQQLLDIQARILTEYPNTPSAHRVKLAQPDTQIWTDPFFNKEMIDITTGNAVAIQDFEGKVTLIAHWADWCSPAHVAIQEAVDVYEKYHPQGLKVLGISGDNKPQKSHDFIDQHALPWSNVSVPWNRAKLKNSAIDFWNHSYTPRFLLVDHEGHILAHPNQSSLCSYVEKAMNGERLSNRQEDVSYDPLNFTGQRAVP